MEILEKPASPTRPQVSVRRSMPPAGWAVVALMAVLLYNAAFTQGFFRIEVREGRLFGSLIDIVNRGTPVMLVALGMTLVIATGGVDLSVGAVMAIAGTIAAGLVARPANSIFTGFRAGLPTIALIGLPLLAALGAGIWNGLLVGFLEIQPIVATLILMVAGRGVAQLMSDGQIITFSHGGFEFLGGGFFLGLPFTLTLLLLVTAVTALLTRGTALGLFIEAVGNNPAASRCAGVNTRAVKIMAYSFCAVCAGLAGLLITSDIKAADANNAGLYVELDAILAVVVGGTALTGGRFSLIGSILGALLIQTLTTTILMRGIPAPFTLVVKAGVIIGVCLLQSANFRKMLLRKGRP